MADLPDLDTSSISFIAYWNAIDDGGATSVDPEEALTDGNIASTTLYDNGADLVYNSPNGRTVNARVKSDGWFIVWIDRTNEKTTEKDDRSNGTWDWLDGVMTKGGPTVADNNNFVQVINSLASNLDNWDVITWNNSDVSLYNYEYPNASAVTVMSNSVYDSNATCGFSYTSGTTIKDAWCVGMAGYNYNDQNSWIDFEGVNVVMANTSTQTNESGTLDLLANNLIPNAATEYQMTQGGGNKNGSNGTVMVIWS